LDYGTGDGHIFNVLRQEEVDGYVYHGYEPVEGQYQQLIANVAENNLDVKCLRSLHDVEKFDVILCAEVLEHFTAADAQKHLEKLRDLLSPDGRLLISVPIEIGIAGFAKNIVRKLIGETHPGLTPTVIVKSLFDRPIFRGSGNYLSSHVGFSYKKLEYLVTDQGFKIERKYFSPAPILRGLLNSQVFFELSIGPRETSIAE
jgi:2-polyprenyl-3-methyl-5-hydroxy-6-metoxy-1,4-benzoquinol methylase